VGFGVGEGRAFLASAVLSRSRWLPTTTPTRANHAVERSGTWLTRRGVVANAGANVTYSTAALSAFLTVALLSGCAAHTADAPEPPAGRGVDGPQPHARSVGYADTFDLSTASKFAITTTLVADTSVLTVTVPDQSGDVTFELTHEQCSLRLVNVLAEAVGATFTEDDVNNSVMVTMIFHGVESPVERPRLTWSVNEGEATLGAHSSLFADEDGAQTLTVSRGVSSTSQIFYSELSCAPGVDAVDVFTRSVSPRVWISAE